MYTTRFITPEEIDYLRVTYAVGRKSLGIPISEEIHENIINNVKQRMLDGITHVVVVFDENNNPVVSCHAFEIPQLLAWRWNGLSSVLGHHHYNKTAAIVAPAQDLMMSFMESKGYYKFWSANRESAHNIRHKIMCKHSTLLSRYNYYDELIIPKGQLSGIPLYDAGLTSAHQDDLLVRMFVLDQKYRVEKFRQLGTEGYRGTLQSHTP